MAPRDEDEGIECEIIESYGIFSEGVKDWNKEVNLVSWNGRPAKIDIRSWQKNHERCGKGIALTRDEAGELVKLLTKILDSRPRKETRGSAPTAKARPRPPQTLEPFYNELKLPFASGPDECKAARNALLKKYHPDKNAANAAFATRKTIRIKEAYDAVMTWWRESGFLTL
ncbi:MAG: PC4/YdbC family ssDNA-binding protein [Treponema sp.]|nr:PC4/YdbC family ssDNA-binding protein [Treponema sp.]